MIEKIILDYLSEKLNVPVRMEENPDIQGEYVIIEKTGSGSTNHLKRATIAIKSFAESMYLAAELNEKVKSAMDEIIELDEVTRCELNSDYNYTNTSRKKYRYQAVFDITHY